MENRPGGAKTSHLLRHMAITSTVRYSNISTTSLYTHLADDELDKAHWETFEKI